MSNIAPIPGDDRLIPLARSEILALFRWHLSQCRRITNKVGQLTLKAGSRRDAGIIIDEGERMVKAHVDRAKELHAILKK